MSEFKLEDSFEREEGEELMHKAAEKARAIIEQAEIQLSDFSDVYDEDEVKQDEAFVLRLRRHFEQNDSPSDKENRRWSVVLEGLIHQEGEQSNWFGPEATTIKPSKYDDFKNAVDEIVQYKSGDILALAVDATFTHQMKDKLLKIKDEIKTGKMATVKYFSPASGDGKGGRDRIPHVLIGADKNTLKDLAELWLTNKKKELAQHFIQFQILESIVLQCGVYAKYARAVNQPSVAAEYEKAQVLIQKIMSEKSKTITYRGQRDKVFRSLQETLRDFEHLG